MLPLLYKNIFTLTKFQHCFDQLFAVNLHKFDLKSQEFQSWPVVPLLLSHSTQLNRFNFIQDLETVDIEMV